MTIAIHPELESKLRARAEAEGLSVEAYLERLVRADQQVEDELEALALEGLHSGEPTDAGPPDGADQHRRLDERLNTTATR